MTIELLGASGQKFSPSTDILKPNIDLAVFGYKSVAPQTSYTLLREMRLMDQLGINFLYDAVEGDALISRSRSKALSRFLEVPDLDVCVMVDHDMVWTPGAIAALAMKAHEKKACVAGLYSCRGRGNGFSSRLMDSDVKLKTMEDKLHDAEYLATGFLAIPRVVAEEVLKAGKEAAAEHLLIGEKDAQPDLGPRNSNMALHPCLYLDGSIFYGFFRCIEVPSTFKAQGSQHHAVGMVGGKLEPAYEYLSEDWSFSWRCRQAAPSRPLYIWTMPWLEHLGQYGFTVLDAGKRER